MCTHIWEINSAEIGRCKLCHRKKNFKKMLYDEKVYQKGIPRRSYREDYEFMGSLKFKGKYDYPVQGTIGKPMGGYGIYDDS